MEVGLVVLWLVMMLVLGAIALPIAAWLLSDLEYGAFAIPIALAILAIVGHLVGHMAFRWPALLAGLGGLLLASAVAVRRVSVEYRSYLEASVIFSLAFLLIVGVRAIEPSAGPLPHYIGEKFLDLGLLNTLERADRLPPEDMWFAGESVRYHYGGHLVTSLLAGLTWTSPAFAYNLGLATFFGVLVSTAWGLAGSIARPMAISRYTAAIMGAFFVGIAGNLETVLRVVTWLAPRRLALWLVDLVGVDDTILEWTPGDFYYFDASRVIQRSFDGDGFFIATEFPMFSWIHGDLHAHIMVKPMILLVLGLLLAYWRTPPEATRRRFLLLLGVVPPVAGLVSVMNIWSFPTVGGLVALTLLFAPGHPLDVLTPTAGSRFDRAIADRLRSNTIASVLTTHVLREAHRILFAGAFALAVLTLGIVWTVPYWWLVVIGGPGQSLTLWENPTPLGAFLVVQGAFVLSFGIYLVAKLVVSADRGLVTLGVAMVFVAVLFLLGYGVLGLLLSMLLIAWSLLRRIGWGESPSVSPLMRMDGGRQVELDFETVLIIAGIGVILIVEVVRLSGEAFNTVFKAYADVWPIWGVALGVVLARLADGWPLSERTDTALAAVGLFLVILLVISTGLYAAFAISTHVSDGSPVTDETGPTLDATAYVEVHYPAEAPAIRWIEDLEGQPTIVTGVEAGYWWEPQRGEGSAAPSSLTGVPTVLGWHHERQYRGNELYTTRLGDVVEIYTGEPPRQTTLLNRYEVDYIYIGPAERNTWHRITIDRHEDVSLAVAYDEVEIYAVDRST